MTILSYVATACISGVDGIAYIKSLFAGVPLLPATIALLFVFALLVVAGIKDSAKVALSIFAVHIAILSAFLILDRKSTRLNSSHQIISYAVFCLKKKKY